MVSDNNEQAGNKVLTLENLNPAVKNVRYAVRGKVVIRAQELEKILKDKSSDLPFKQVIRANIGDCHATGQNPITYLRQLQALCAYPDLLRSEIFPEDVKEKARRLLKDCGGGSVGSYTQSSGLQIVRKAVAKFISKRDEGVPANFDDIFLTTGASGGIKIIMKLLLNAHDKKTAGFMIPIPQYPLYSATISEFSAEKIGYILSEENDWCLTVEELERAYQSSLDRCEPKAICIINPGNPTGQVLNLENIQAIIKWAYSKRLFILADEVNNFLIYSEIFLNKYFHIR